MVANGYKRLLRNCFIFFDQLLSFCLIFTALFVKDLEINNLSKYLLQDLRPRSFSPRISLSPASHVASSKNNLPENLSCKMRSTFLTLLLLLHWPYFNTIPIYLLLPKFFTQIFYYILESLDLQYFNGISIHTVYLFV